MLCSIVWIVKKTVEWNETQSSCIHRVFEQVQCLSLKSHILWWIKAICFTCYSSTFWNKRMLGWKFCFQLLVYVYIVSHNLILYSKLWLLRFNLITQF